MTAELALVQYGALSVQTSIGSMRVNVGQG